MTHLPAALLRTAAAGIAAVALAVQLPAPAPARTLDGAGQPVTNAAGVTFGVLAHRGGAHQWPENSLEAFTNSAAAGFDAIETDVLFTSDGHAVLNHYDRLPARCTHAGQQVHRMTLAQVSKVRCADLAGRKVVPIPTFEALGEVLAGHPEVGLVLDIKSYSGQSAAGKRSYATRAISLARSHGLLARTSIVSFHWAAALPAIRKVAPALPVLALDDRKLDLGRVRLAARLGANAFGIRMRDTSAYLARYIRANGLDPAPWKVVGDEQLAFAIHYGGRVQLLSSDRPAVMRADLLSGRVELDPVPKPVTTGLRRPVTISDTTYRAGKPGNKPVLGKAVPESGLSQLDTVTLAITVRNGPGKGRLYVGATSSPQSSSVALDLPRGTRTLTVAAPLGNGGRVRIEASRTVRLKVKVTAYTRVRFG